jgi:hypothetical protein
MNINRMMYMMYKYIITCKRLLDRAPVCMRSECSFIIVDFLFVSLWNPRPSIGLVPCGMVSRSIVVHWDSAWSASHPWSAVLSAEVGQVRAESAQFIAAPRQRALYPILPALTCPAVLLYLCVCVSLLCVSDLTYLSPFVSLSLCYCRNGEGRPSILQPVMAIPRPVRSFCSRERTPPRRTM